MRGHSLKPAAFNIIAASFPYNAVLNIRPIVSQTLHLSSENFIDEINWNDTYPRYPSASCSEGNEYSAGDQHPTQTPALISPRDTNRRCAKVIEKTRV